MGKRNAAAAIVDADRLQQFETPPKRIKHHHGPGSATDTAPVATTDSSPAIAFEPSSPNISASEFELSKEFVDGTLLMDLTLKQWRIGKPIGKGSFGEIFLASDDINTPVTSENAKYVVKIEPHSNGPLFVEIHCLLNTAKRTETNVIPPGMPEYIASGSHLFGDVRYRFLILKRYQRDLHSLIKNKRVNPKSIPVIACQILDVLEHLHDQGYVHSDIKAENLMIGTVEEVATLNGQNGMDDNPHHRTNGVVTLPEGKASRRGKKASAELLINGGGAATVQENGLYYHQEQEMCTRGRNLRPLKTVTYRDLSDEDERSGSAGGSTAAAVASRSRANLPKRRGRKRKEDSSFSCSISPRRSGYEELKAATEEAHWQELKRAALPKAPVEVQMPAEERIHLIDFGLASKFVDSTDRHRPFCMDQRRAHDGTLEFTSRDAHMGAHARRSDLECLGYNLVYWSRGFLPWKDEKLLNQPEQVHRMKEYFMIDVREMLRLIYGDDCPAYLGEFLAYVGKLTYDERPDYQYCKSLFYKELKRLGCPVSRAQPLRLDVNAIVQFSEPLTAQDEAEITNKINHVKSLMKLGALIPYRESTLHSKASSPKNLRSKRSDANGRNSLALAASTTTTPTTTTVTDGGAAATVAASVPNATTTVCTRKKEKQFSCEEIFATDADQIARDRAEKEFLRAEKMEETVIRYTGKPTYAIQELLERKSRGHSLGGGLEYTESEGYIKGYTKPMMDILRKRQSQLFLQIAEMNTTADKSAEASRTKGLLNGDSKKKGSMPSDSENAPMEQDSDDAVAEENEEEVEEEEEEEGEDEEEEEEADEEVEEVEEGTATPQGNDLEDDEDDVSVKLSKYEQDDDFELASDDEDEEDLVEDDEKDGASEEIEDEEVEDYEEEEEDEEEEEEEEDEEEEEEQTVTQNGYGSRESSAYRRRRKTVSKSRSKKEDTDSDFINDGGCEMEEAATYHSNLPDEGVDEEEEDNVEGDEEDQQDSDFNDQDSTATGSDVVMAPKQKRRVDKPPPRSDGPHAQKSHATFADRKADKGRHRRGDKNGSKKSLRRNHDEHEEEATDDDDHRHRATAKQRSQRHRKKSRHQVLDDGDGDNARAELDDGRETVRKQQNHHHHYNNNNHCNSKAYYGDVDDSSHDMAPPPPSTDRLTDRNASMYRYVKRRKSGLRERIRPTDRGTDYADNMQRKRKAALQNKRRRESAALHGQLDSTAVPMAGEDDYSCSSSGSSSSSSASSRSSSSLCTSNRIRAISQSSSAASLDSGSIVVSIPTKARHGRKRKQVSAVSSRDSSGTRQSSAKCRTTVEKTTGRPRKRTNVTDNDTGHSNSHWSPPNSTATSRASSVSASGHHGAAQEYGMNLPKRLATLPEHHHQHHHHQNDDFIDEDDGDDTRDVDYSPISTRRRRKATAGGTEALNGGTISRKASSSTAIRKRNDSKGTLRSVIVKGTGSAAPPPSLASSSAVNDIGGISLPRAYGSSSSVPRRLEHIQPPPPAPVAAAAALIHHHHQQRIRRPQHHIAYPNYYRVNDQHHLPSTMLVRTYSRG
ncbi:uncharacterized protein LOC126567760 [Anopheles maculipalpis]|uniref:uncharacterized protein LOC126567760 n=1 Tax=Anopheles maculipalpis TaxID=1496333 RepID=UPI002158F27F|nr:uncharacterized protein LOC126567760 [Anopheles maculipalpis]